MSKHNRTEVVRVLREQMEATTDPQTKVDLAKQLAKLLPKPRQVRRPRKVEATPIKVTKGASAVVAKWADRLSHVEPEAKRIELSYQLEVEKRYKSRGIQLWPPSPDSRERLQEIILEVLGELSVHEQAVLNGGSPEVA